MVPAVIRWRAMAPWSPMIDPSLPPKDAAALKSVQPLLLRLIAAYGTNAVARMLDVDPAMITRWKKGGQVSGLMRKRILDLHDVLSRALQIFSPETTMQWLVGHEPFLNDARPIDVLALRGAAPLIEALEGIESGGYA